MTKPFINKSCLSLFFLKPFSLCGCGLNKTSTGLVLMLVVGLLAVVVVVVSAIVCPLLMVMRGVRHRLTYACLYVQFQ